jgi:hypothetical protein
MSAGAAVPRFILRSFADLTRAEQILRSTEQSAFILSAFGKLFERIAPTPPFASCSFVGLYCRVRIVA